MGKASKKRAGQSSTRVATARGSKDTRSEQRETGALRTKKAKPPAVGIAGVPGSKNDSRRCTATANRTGERCHAPAIKGGNVCRQHGGSLPGVKKAAQERLMAMVEPAMVELRRIIDKSDTSDADKLRAIQMVLDRTGYKAGVTVEVGLSKFDELLAGSIGMNPDTGAIEVARDLDALPPGGGDDVWEDLNQIAEDAQADIDRERHNEEARERLSRFDPFDGNTVRGEVIATDDEPGPFPAPPPTGPSEYGGGPK